jgi:hypothetical protein
MRALLLLLVPATALARPSLPGWKHVTHVSKCHVRVEAAPDAEKEALLLRARKQLHSTEVTLWDIGDAVRSVDIPAVPGHPRALEGPTARKAATDFVLANASLFGIEPKLDKLKPRETEQDENNGGWTAAGEITRTFEGVEQTERYVVTFDSDGHIASVKLGPERVLPAVPLCKTTPLRPTDPKVATSLLGQKLIVHAIGRDLDGGVVTLKNIGKRYPAVILFGDKELARVIAVEVKSLDKKLARATWTYYVDGDSGAVLEQHVQAPPDL